MADKEPQELQSHAKNQIDAFNLLKGEIYAELLAVHEGLGRVKQKVSANVKSPQNPNGLLTRQEQAYNDCLELKKCEFEVLLQEDQAFWTENLDEAKKVKDDFRNQIEEMMLRHKKELEEKFNLQRAAPQPKFKYSLKKLQRWGSKTSNINFEWPTQAIFDKMKQADVSLKSIMFKTAYGGISPISSLKCTLSNGEQSQIFEQAGQRHEHQQTIEFDKNTPIRAVAANGHDSGNNYGYILRMRFLDGAGNEVKVYNPRNNQKETTEHKLGDNEELIGVYGSIGPHDNYLYSFGFIVKVKEPI